MDKNKRKKRILAAVAGVACLAVIVAGVVIYTTGNNGADASARDPALEDEETGSAESGTDGSDGDGSSDTEDGTEGVGSFSSSSSSGGASSSGSSSGSGSSESGSSVSGGEVSFPFTVTGTSLSVQSISSYDGVFLEDGSDEEVTGIAAMVVENTGDTDLEYASLSIECDGETLEFEGSDIPAGATVVIQEKNRASWQDGTYSGCTATVAETDGLEMAEEVSVTETDDGSLLVTNLTDEEIPCVRIFYKFYMEDEDAYVGGITYTAKLTGLAAGGSRTVTPSHYASGSSKVMMVRTYDTAD